MFKNRSYCIGIVLFLASMLGSLPSAMAQQDAQERKIKIMLESCPWSNVYEGEKFQHQVSDVRVSEKDLSYTSWTRGERDERAGTKHVWMIPLDFVMSSIEKKGEVIYVVFKCQTGKCIAVNADDNESVRKLSESWVGACSEKHAKDLIDAIIVKSGVR